jgi:hypothetical protein
VRRAIEDRNIFEFGFRSGDEVAPKCGGRLKTETNSNSGFVRPFSRSRGEFGNGAETEKRLSRRLAEERYGGFGL